jgi:hypothetical protein
MRCEEKETNTKVVIKHLNEKKGDKGVNPTLFLKLVLFNSFSDNFCSYSSLFLHLIG